LSTDGVIVLLSWSRRSAANSSPLPGQTLHAVNKGAPGRGSTLRIVDAFRYSMNWSFAARRVAGRRARQ
jgi:hypothetical protein